MGRIRVLIVDDHKVFCEALASFLSSQPDIEVVGIAHSPAEALRSIGLEKPDVILLDLEMKGGDGTTILAHLKGQFPSVKTIILTMHCEEYYLIETVSQVEGYVLKECSGQEVIRAIRTVFRGGRYFDPSIHSALADILRHQRSGRKGRDEPLTLREKQVLGLLSKGLTTKEIGSRLGISPHTVRNHITRIFERLNVDCRLKAVNEGRKRGLIPSS